MSSLKEAVVISVGGSLIAPSKISTKFLKAFKTTIKKEIEAGRRFVIIVGGGNTAREYQKAARNLTTLTPVDIDWLGIHATRLNAHLLRTIFHKEAHPVIIKNPNNAPRTRKHIIIAAGWKPGASTDYDAVLIAKTLGIKRMVNLSNIDYVYDKDPKKYKAAKPIKTMKWNKFRQLLPKKWDPGLNAPFDPIAAREAEKLGMEVAIINGNKIERFTSYLKGRLFSGTIIN